MIYAPLFFFLGGVLKANYPSFFGGDVVVGGCGRAQKTSTINNNSKISSLQLSQANKTPPSERIPTTPAFFEVSQTSRVVQPTGAAGPAAS